jgi:hypothetical protein
MAFRVVMQADDRVFLQVRNASGGNAKTCQNPSPSIHKAVQKRDLKAVQAFIATGADLNATGPDGN